MQASQQKASITTTAMLGKQSNKALYQCVELAFGDMELCFVEQFAEMREELETLLVCNTYCNLKIEFMNSIFTRELGQLHTVVDCLYLVLQSVFPINAANARSYPG